MIDTARANAAFLQAFGRDDVSLRGTGYTLALRGIFSAAYGKLPMGGMNISSPYPQLHVLESTLLDNAITPQPGDHADIGTTVYTIASISTVEGMTEMELRAYA